MVRFLPTTVKGQLGPPSWYRSSVPSEQGLPVGDIPSINQSARPSEDPLPAADSGMLTGIAPAAGWVADCPVPDTVQLLLLGLGIAVCWKRRPTPSLL